MCCKVYFELDGGKIQHDKVWLYNGRKLDVMDEFKYLGLLFKCNATFALTSTSKNYRF